MAEDFNTDSMLDMFLYESEQLLETLQNTVLEKKDEDCFDETSINEIFRVMHTIKGSSGIMMYENITKVAHKLEDVFYYLRESHPENVPHLELVDHVLDVADFITGELDKIKDGETPDGDETKIVEEIDKFLKRIKSGIEEKGNELPPENTYVEPSQFYIAPTGSESYKYYKASIYYRSDTQMCNIRAYTAVYSLKEITDDMEYMPDDIISNEDSGTVILEDGFHMLIKCQCSREEILSAIGDTSGMERVEINDCTQQEFEMGFHDHGPEPIIIEMDDKEKKDAGKKEEKKEPAPGDYVIKGKETGKGKKLVKNQPKPSPKQTYISVNVEKMDALMDMIGELVISEAVVLQNPDLKVPGLDLTNFQKASGQLAKITTELQDVIMSMRMMPLTNTFQKMNRIVFDVSRKLGKDIELEVIGENTEVDKNIIEHISDPLMHLIRNSVDHGIEEKEDRIAAGKNPRGKITLEAKNEGGKVYIIVRDDGKGLNKEVLYNKARNNGLIGNRPMSDFTDKEIYQFITFAGFSTKEQVTEYSGRGVGMDVVVKNIQAIGGKLEIDSMEGAGSEMIMKIPLTLAIINGIVMQVGNSTFVIETNAVKEFVRINKDTIVREPDGEEYVMLRGECYPFIRLNEMYHLPGSNTDIEEGIVVVLEHENKYIGVFIDQLIAEQEIVVKPIPSYIKKVQGLSGCTQLGDGSIALILDIAGLIAGQERSS
ncbi:chemotaxis protein CheA [Petralouisia muris]|uniref:Chemotaxis protein CheA n=1 Tax=Petralouisia muris TaxID=3032872 RepID=A0AC61RYN7_9FIRM|nr:chemotaxis protein CheA [Petralouisia muris]TGY97088.1 chemotaxis protein CheA [Petralouisia muris]